MTNFLSIHLSEKQKTELTNQLMINQLKELYINAGNQYQIYAYPKEKDKCIESLIRTSEGGFTQKNSCAFAFDRTGKMLFFACNNKTVNKTIFSDVKVLDKLNGDFDSGKEQGSIVFDIGHGEYYGIYKYHHDWNCYFVRAESRSDSLMQMYKVIGITAGIRFVSSTSASSFISLLTLMCRLL